MTALDHRTAAIAAETRTVAAVTRMADGLRALFRAISNRREVGNLAQLSDHHLADIGLTRTDLAVALRTPIDVDPTVRLDVMARERLAIEIAARRTC